MSRAYPPADATDENAEIKEELVKLKLARHGRPVQTAVKTVVVFCSRPDGRPCVASLMDDDHLQELRTVASQRTIDAIYAAAADDDEYTKLKQQ